MEGSIFDGLIEGVMRIGIAIGIGVTLASAGFLWLAIYLYHHLQWVD
jgi:hypothetical protein